MISGSVKKSRSSTFTGCLLPRCRTESRARGPSASWGCAAWLFPRSGESVQGEDGGRELDVRVEGGGWVRLDAGDGGAVQLEVLDALVRLVRALVVVHLPVRTGEGDRIPAEDLVDGEQVVSPPELADPG